MTSYCLKAPFFAVKVKILNRFCAAMVRSTGITGDGPCPASLNLTFLLKPNRFLLRIVNLAYRAQPYINSIERARQVLRDQHF